MPIVKQATFSLHLGHAQERAFRYLLNDRKHLPPEPAPEKAKPFSIRLGSDREAALTKLALSRKLYDPETARPQSGWLLIVKASIDAYLDREVPDWDSKKIARAGGDRKGFNIVSLAAIDDYLDQAVPGWNDERLKKLQTKAEKAEIKALARAKRIERKAELLVEREIKALARLQKLETKRLAALAAVDKIDLQILAARELIEETRKAENPASLADSAGIPRIGVGRHTKNDRS